MILYHKVVIAAITKQRLSICPETCSKSLITKVEA